MGTVPEDQLDGLLEEKLIFLVDATGIPVLLSLLVLIFTAGGEDLTKLPSNRIELYELGIESAINKRLQRGQPAKDDTGPMIYDQLVRHWMRLFNLDRSNMAVVEDNPQFEVKKEREHRPTRKAAMKFDELRNAAADIQMHEKRETSEKQTEKTQGATVFKLDNRETYEVFKHGAHYLREANKPEVQRTELNRIELSMPKKLVDTIMTLVNANLKLLLGGLAPSFGLAMLRNVAVTNQQNGRREFSSAHVAHALLLEFPSPEGFTLWIHLNKEDGGLPLIKTLEVQTEMGPAQYQFKHLSFQEGLFAQHLLIQAEAGWEGWATDEDSALFLNNPFMNNTCRIAAGHLGTLLAKRRLFWDFTKSKLDEVGLQALWLLMEKNASLTRLSLKSNRVGGTVTDASGVARMLTTSTALVHLDLSKNLLGSLKQHLRVLARGLSANKSLTQIDVSSNGLWPDGTRIMCNAIKSCSSMRRVRAILLVLYSGLHVLSRIRIALRCSQVDISFNHPGRESALAELLRVHPSLTSFGCIEAEPTTRIERSFHLDSRGKESIGRALLESAGQLQFLQCDAFKLTPDTTVLTWNTNQQCDAVVLAGVLKKNVTLTTLNVMSGKGEMGDYEREEIGKALLANKNGKLGFCDIFGLNAGGSKTYTCDLRDKEQVRSLRSFHLLAGCLRANATLTCLSLRSLNNEHVEPLSEALRWNSHLKELKLEHPTKGNDSMVTSLPVQQLNGSRKTKTIDISGAGEAIVSGKREMAHCSRFACAMVGALLAENSSVEALKVNPGSASEGGAFLEHLHRAKTSSLHTLDLSAIGLGDRGGAKLFESLHTGMCPMITTFKLGNNMLADQAVGPLMVEVLRADTCTITALDLSGNNISGAVIARAIQLNKSLTSLDVRDNPPIDDTALWVLGGLLLGEACLCRLGYLRTYAFEVVEDAQSLDFNDLRFEAGAAKLLAGVMKFNPVVEALCLSGCGLESSTTPALAQALLSNQVLTSIDLSKNPLCDSTSSTLDEKGLLALAEAVNQSGSMQQLTLEGSVLPVRTLKGVVVKKKEERKSRGSAGQRGEAGSDGAVHCRQIDLSSHNIGKVSLTLIAALIQHNTHLTDLNLQSNDIGPEGMRTIVDSVSEENLSALDLSSNVRPLMSGTSKFEQQQKLLSEFTTALGRLTALERLSLDRNEMTLLTSVGSLINLRVLTLSHNKLQALPEDLCLLRQLKKLAVQHNKLRDLNLSIGQLENLESLDLRANELTFLPASIGQLVSLKHLDLSENQLSQLVLSICDLANLEKIEVKNNPLQRPPIGTAKQGIGAIRRYFQEIARAGEAMSNAARLVLLGHGESGKTSLQRGLRAGTASPAEMDERTIQLDIYSMMLGGTDGSEQILISMWDLAGQPQYAAGLQPYMVSGSLYLLLVPAIPVAELDQGYGDLVGRWMDYLTAGAPEAVVVPILTHCDKMLPALSKDKSPRAFEEACSSQATWFCEALKRHQAAQLVNDGFKPLQVQEQVICVSCIEGGDATLAVLKTKLEELVLCKPPLLPSVGQMIPRTWLQAIAFLRSLRDGRDPVAAARAAVPSAAEVERMERGLAEASEASGGSGFSAGARPYMTMAEAEHTWLEDVVPALGNSAGIDVMHDALQLLVNQGEIFSSSGIIYLQPDYITRLLKPLVDHRLTRSRFQQTLGSLPGDAETQSRRASLLLPACEIFVRSGELREELLLPMWQPLGLHGDDYADVMVMLSASGVLFLAQHLSHGRRWVMPMRLPETRPLDAFEEWNAIAETPDTEKMSIGYRLGRFAPPGISERLTAACKGLGDYCAFWKRGAILSTSIEGTQLLLEIRSTAVPGTASGAQEMRHELCVDVRGPRSARADVWLLLLRVQEVTERLLDDFPGIYPDGVFYCPGCSSNAELPQGPKAWPLADVTSKHLKCEQCTEALALHVVRLQRQEAATTASTDDRDSAGLFITPSRMVLAEADDDGGGSFRGSEGSFRGGGKMGTPDASFRKELGSPITSESGGGQGSPAGSPAKPAGSPAKRESLATGSFKKRVSNVMSVINAGESKDAKGDMAQEDGASRSTAAVASVGLLTREPANLSISERKTVARLLRQMRFVGRHVRFGRPIEAGVGMHKLLGLNSENEMRLLLDKGEGAIIDEVAAAGLSVRRCRAH